MPSWSDTAIDVGLDNAWETYHENAKRSRRLGAPLRSRVMPGKEAEPHSSDAQIFALQAGGSLVTLPGEGTVDPGYAGAGVMPLASLAALLGAAGRPIDDGDPVGMIVHANAVETLPAGLYRHDPAARALVLLSREALGRPLAAATDEPDLVARAQAVVFLVGALERAAAAKGERGYRDALFFAGRHAQVFDHLAPTSGLWCQEIGGFYDREVDGLLGFDGLSLSVLGVIVVGTAADG